MTAAERRIRRIARRVTHGTVGNWTYCSLRAATHRPIVLTDDPRRVTCANCRRAMRVGR